MIEVPLVASTCKWIGTGALTGQHVVGTYTVALPGPDLAPVVF